MDQEYDHTFYSCGPNHCHHLLAGLLQYSLYRILTSPFWLFTFFFYFPHSRLAWFFKMKIKLCHSAQISIGSPCHLIWATEPSVWPGRPSTFLSSSPSTLLTQALPVAKPGPAFKPSSWLFPFSRSLHKWTPLGKHNLRILSRGAYSSLALSPCFLT